MASAEIKLCRMDKEQQQLKHWLTIQATNERATTFPLKFWFYRESFTKTVVIPVVVTVYEKENDTDSRNPEKKEYTLVVA